VVALEHGFGRRLAVVGGQHGGAPSAEGAEGVKVELREAVRFLRRRLRRAHIDGGRSDARGRAHVNEG
jgi:hypothetical protein